MKLPLRTCIAAAVLLGGPAGGKTLHVDSTLGSDAATGGASDPLRTLPVAVSRSAPDDTILLQPGTYAVRDLAIGHPLIIRGAGEPETVLVPGEGNGSALLRVTASDVFIESLSLRGTGDGPRAESAVVASPNAERLSLLSLDAEGFSGDVLVMQGGAHHRVLAVRVAEFGDRSGEAREATAHALVLGGSALVRGLTVASGDAGVSVRAIGGIIEESRFQSLSESYVAFASGSGAVRGCTFEGADGSGSVAAGGGTGIVIRDLATAGEEVLAEGNHFARIGAMTVIEDGRVDWFEAPASVTFRRNTGYNLRAASRVAASATNGPLDVAFEENFVEYSPGIVVEDFLLRDGFNAFVFDENTFRGYRALGDNGGSALRAKFSQWDPAASRTVAITATHAWDYGTALDLSAQGLVQFDVTGDTRIRHCGTAVRVEGTGADLLLEGGHFHQNALALDLGNRAAEVRASAFEQDGHSVVAARGLAPMFAGNWYRTYFAEDTAGLEYSPQPVSVAPGVTDLGPAYRYDRDLDGIPDVREERLGLDPLLRETDGSGIPDGIALFIRRYPGISLVDTDRDLVPDAIDVGPLSKDFDGDGVADWYEMARGNDPRRPDDYPPIGDVLEDGSVNLADAVRALQLINGTVPFTLEYGDLNELNVTGESNLRTLNQPLQIIRFQNGSRQAFPGLAGFE